MAAEGSGRRRRIDNSTSTEESGGAGKPAATGRRPARRHRGDEPLDVRIEFVVLDGEAGKALARRQAVVIRQVLQWIHDNPAGVAQDASGTDGAG
jgi:hypothetical protein